MSSFLLRHVVFGLILLATLTCALEFTEENPSTNISAEDTEEAAVAPKWIKTDASFAKDTLHRRNKAGEGNSLKELWEVVPLKQQQKVGIK